MIHCIEGNRSYRRTCDHPGKKKLGQNFTSERQRTSFFSPSTAIRMLHSNKLLTGCQYVRQIKIEVLTSGPACLTASHSPHSITGWGSCSTIGDYGVAHGREEVRERKLYLLTISFVLGPDVATSCE